MDWKTRWFKGRAPADGSHRADREIHISDESRQLRQAIAGWYSECRSAISQYFVQISPIAARCDTIKKEIEAAEKRIMGEENEFIVDAQQDHLNAARELDKFKRDFSDVLKGRSPDISKSVYKTLVILLTVIIVESAINAILFMKAMTTGLLGGMAVAFGISLFNVVTGVFAGLVGLRYVFHPERNYRIMGGAALTVIFTFGLFLNLFVAHFRDGVERRISEIVNSGGLLSSIDIMSVSPKDIVTHMFSNPLGFDSIIAVVLLGIGFIAFSIGLYEGYCRIADRFPGYGSVWRRERKAFDQRMAEQTKLRQRINFMHACYRLWLQDQIGIHNQARRDIASAIEWLRRRAEMATSATKSISEQEERLLTTYRSANQRARRANRAKLGHDAQAPSYFAEKIHLSNMDFDLANCSEAAKKLSDRIQSNIVELEKAQEWLNDRATEVDAQLDRLAEKERSSGEETARQARLGHMRPVA